MEATQLKLTAYGAVLNCAWNATFTLEQGKYSKKKLVEFAKKAFQSSQQFFQFGYVKNCSSSEEGIIEKFVVYAKKGVKVKKYKTPLGDMREIKVGGKALWHKIPADSEILIVRLEN